MAEIAERMVKIIADAAYAEARGVCPMNIEALTAGIDRLVADACAESEAARLKAEGERDEAVRMHDVVRQICAEARVHHPALLLRNLRAAEARLREFEQHEAETHASLGAILGTDTSLLDGAKRMQARLRAVIEAVLALTTRIEFRAGDYETVEAYRRIRDAQASPEPEASYIDIVFDGPPEHEAGRFVEVENPEGRSVRVGKWIKRENGWWSLRLPWSQHGGLLREEGRRG